ncbi:Glucanosyltransferase-domain-containing protein [Penicillium cf. viridicatum]|uniref:1,3-beta-glucanosyltransferase n=1 Tax=Penicillium cf. viridicatum TaxID=2972119 RepID=A0A9W9MBS9_9EURO|nr:Glucanosyltransferase-domain-containing protein [Penicillium cf. viridicatum]
MKLSTIIAGATLLASTAMAELDPIVIKGSKFFFKSNETQFFMRGVAYQQELPNSGAAGVFYKDILADTDACKRDVPLLQELRTNTIRVYSIDPKADHTECMKLLTDAGIYVVVDMANPAESIIRNNPSWDNALYKRYIGVVDEMAKYTNTIGFFAGNEVSNQKNNTLASAFVKAAVRDVKRYIKAKGYRTMGVGYASNDDADIREEMAKYFNCQSEEESIDFWGYNVYSWCGDSSYDKSGYKARTEEFAKYSVPVFFAEYGCNLVRPRKFTDVAALFGDKMTDVWSGGIVYMYFQEENDYGLVTLKGDTASKLPDFSGYSKQMASVNPTGVKKAVYSPSNSALGSCPTIGGNWFAKASPLPPSPNTDLCTCMATSLECAVKDNVSSKKFADLFDTVCGYGVCDGISTNATSGEYGSYSVCSAKEKLSFAFDRYYQKQKAKGNQASACDFDGAASTRASEKPGATCSTLLNAAGTEGTGTVTASPTGGSGSGSVSGSGSAASATGAAQHRATLSSVSFGILHIGAYVLIALVTGFGMILL